jgi:hypothetical protein
MSGPGGGLNSAAVERLRAARARHNAKVAKIEAGVADARTTEAVHAAYRATNGTPGELSDDAKGYIHMTVADQLDADMNPTKLGESIAKRLGEVEEFQRTGGFAGMLGRSAFSPRAAFDSVGQDVEAVRRKSAALTVPPSSGLAEWREAIDARGERQTNALEGLLALARQQDKTSRRMVVLTLATLIVAMVAAVATIIAL